MSTEGRRWFEQRKEFVARAPETDGTPERWIKCPSCGEMLFDESLAERMDVCPHCQHHFPVDGPTRILQLADPDSARFHDDALAPVDTLAFVDSKPYGKRIEATRRSLSRNDAFVSASARLDGLDVEMGSFDFRFMGGSMGSVVGEMITRVYERATARGVPAIVVSASGGARMQEGVLSLMQMAKTCAALGRLKDEARMPYISVLTHPTTGGVAASFAMLGDVILAEPRALIGFAGPRVIQQTIGSKLPDGFQTSEYLLDHGMVDHIVHRHALRETMSQVLRLLLKRPVRDAAEAATSP
jgi:acetyl-CoA carboxylase carboxyl transferase subunit beta